MKRILPLLPAFLLFACGNKKKTETETTNSPATETTTTNTSNNTATSPGSSTMTVNIDGKDMSLNASALISKDDKNILAGAPWFAMVTASNGPDNESLILNFVFDLKAGDYPVVGVGLNRGPSDNGQVFGGLLGGEPKITQWKVHLTEVKDLGSNNVGGHKWSISGTFDDMTVPAMELMLLDKEKNHPKEVVIRGGSFSNLTFDDNWEELMEKAFEKMKDN